MSIDLGSTSATFRYLSSNMTRSLQLEADDPSVALETKYFQDNIGNVKSIDDFLSNTRLFTYAMKAFGLEDMDTAKAFMRKVMTEGVSDPKSFANQLNDPRFVQFATTFNFATNGADATSSTAVQQGVVQNYIEQSLEDDAGADDQGVRLALYFQRMAPNIKTAYDLLGDAALWQVAQTVYGFPPEMASADIDQQAKAVDAQVDFSAFQDPTKLNQLLQRFTAVWDATQNSASDPILALFTDTSSQNVSSDTSMSILSLFTGGPSQSNSG